MEIKDKKGSENSVADHLSRLHWEGEAQSDIAIDDSIPGEQLYSLMAFTDSTACGPHDDPCGPQVVHAKHISSLKPAPVPWYADFANFLVVGIYPPGMTYQQRKKFKAFRLIPSGCVLLILLLLFLYLWFCALRAVHDSAWGGSRNKPES
jgi:hypothetical protein